jgi:ribosomal protein S9
MHFTKNGTYVDIFIYMHTKRRGKPAAKQLKKQLVEKVPYRIVVAEVDGKIDRIVKVTGAGHTGPNKPLRKSLGVKDILADAGVVEEIHRDVKVTGGGHTGPRRKLYGTERS